ncbi:DUF6126 family protein [Phaeacidiphilus oryzae]|uniref:DUF6126 family protein n=1 Tax=Phaeacidiphilus oryzae TaxID=348818 RepID=UPI00056B6F4C|nr:DUF6126 family protein [Phaeacidiphilus oryzae]
MTQPPEDPVAEPAPAAPRTPVAPAAPAAQPAPAAPVMERLITTMDDDGDRRTEARVGIRVLFFFIGLHAIAGLVMLLFYVGDHAHH